MTHFHLDTSVQAVRLFYFVNDAKLIEDYFDKQHSYSLSVSKYSWFEFYHTWIFDLCTIMLASYATNSLSEFFAELSKSFLPRNRLLMTFSSLISDTSDISTKEISIRAYRLLKHELKTAFNHYRRKKITLTDKLSCNILKAIEQEFTVYEEHGVPKFRPPEHETCSKKRANCNIVQFISPNTSKLEQALQALKSSERDKAFQKYAPDIISDPNKAKGSKCGKISDFLMILEAPKSSLILTTDEDWKIIATSLKIKNHKFSIPPKYQKYQIKAAMMQ